MEQGFGITFSMLGPLRASVAGREVPLGGKKQRGVLALLLLRAGEVVPDDEFLEALWADSAPAATPRARRWP